MSTFAHNCGFWPMEANTMNTPYCLMQNLAWISKAPLLQESSKRKNLRMLLVLQRLSNAYGF